MNNIIEVLQEIKKYYAQDTIRGTETGSKRFKAITKAIANEKVLESAEGLLEKKGAETEQEADKLTKDCPYTCKTCGTSPYHFDFVTNQAIDLCQRVLAKQILKVEALEKSLESVGDVDDMKDTIWDIMQVALDKNHYITKREELEEILLDCKIPELVAAALKPVISKQILKNEKLEEALNTLMNEVFSGQASMSSYGYKKAQKAKIKEIENEN